jgi:hypothetical protein
MRIISELFLRSRKQHVSGKIIILHYSTNIIKVIRYKRIRWEGHTTIAQMGNGGNA